MNDNIFIGTLLFLLVTFVMVEAFVPNWNRIEAYVVLPIMAIASPIFLIGAFRVQRRAFDVHEQRQKEGDRRKS